MQSGVLCVLLRLPLELTLDLCGLLYSNREPPEHLRAVAQQLQVDHLRT